MNYCLDCEKEISKNAKRCRSCSKKGKNNPIFNETHSSKTLQKMRQIKMGTNNPFYNKCHTKESGLQMSKSRMGNKNSTTWKTRYRKNNIPLYEKFAPRIEFCEKVRRNKKDSNILEITCAYCGNWYIPNINETYNRIASINKIGDSRFYCSDTCKKECPIYKQIKFPKGFHGKQGSSREVQPELRQMVFERDNWTCQRCWAKESLHCHHLTGVELNPIESADIDNCITLCKTCHHWIHSQEGCKYSDFRRKKCENPTNF